MHERLFAQQVPFFLDAWTEIYEILEFNAVDASLVNPTRADSLRMI